MSGLCTGVTMASQSKLLVILKNIHDYFQYWWNLNVFTSGSR